MTPCLSGLHLYSSWRLYTYIFCPNACAPALLSFTPNQVLCVTIAGLVEFYWCGIRSAARHFPARRPFPVGKLAGTIIQLYFLFQYLFLLSHVRITCWAYKYTWYLLSLTWLLLNVNIVILNWPINVLRSHSIWNQILSSLYIIQLGLFMTMLNLWFYLVCK